MAEYLYRVIIIIRISGGAFVHSNYQIGINGGEPVESNYYNRDQLRIICIQ